MTVRRGDCAQESPSHPIDGVILVLGSLHEVGMAAVWLKIGQVVCREGEDLVEEERIGESLPRDIVLKSLLSQGGVRKGSIGHRSIMMHKLEIRNPSASRLGLVEIG